MELSPSTINTTSIQAHKPSPQTIPRAAITAAIINATLLFALAHAKTYNTFELHII